MEPTLSLGVDAATGRPLVAKLSLLLRHVWTMGMTGAAKTLYVVWLLLQILALDPSACIVVADFGGDQYMFHRLLGAAQAQRKRFRFLSANAEDDWDSFEPLQSVWPLRGYPATFSGGKLVLERCIAIGRKESSQEQVDAADAHHGFAGIGANFIVLAQAA